MVRFTRMDAQLPALGDAERSVDEELRGRSACKGARPQRVRASALRLRAFARSLVFRLSSESAPHHGLAPSKQPLPQFLLLGR